MEVPGKREIHFWLCLKWQQLWNRMASKPVSSNSAIKPYKVALPVTSATNWEDKLYEDIRENLQDIDGLIVGSPVYYAGPNGSLCAILDRVFYSCSDMLAYKPAAAIAVCRRGGASATIDRLNKYFTINNMPVVSSQYWNIIHGRLPGEAAQDAEGLQIMRTLGKNMAWLLKNIKAGAQPLPETEERQITNFIR